MCAVWRLRGQSWWARSRLIAVRQKVSNFWKFVFVIFGLHLDMSRHRYSLEDRIELDQGSKGNDETKEELEVFGE